MLEGPRSLVCKLSEQLVAGVAEFNKLGGRDQLEDLLEKEDQRISCNRHQRTEKHIYNRVIVRQSARALDQAEGTPHERHHRKDYQCCNKLEPSPVEESEHQHSHSSCDKIHHEEFHSVRSEDQHRKQRDEIDREHHPLAEESKHIE